MTLLKAKSSTNVDFTIPAKYYGEFEMAKKDSPAGILGGPLSMTRSRLHHNASEGLFGKEQAVIVVRCATCNYENPIDSRFCNRCTFPLESLLCSSWSSL